MVPELKTCDVEHSHLADSPTSLFTVASTSLVTKVSSAKCGVHEHTGPIAQLPMSGGKCVFARLLAKQLTSGRQCMVGSDNTCK